MKCFLSCSFREEDKAIREWFAQFLVQLGYEVRIGTDAVCHGNDGARKLILGCPVTFALCVERENSRIPDLVSQELALALASGKPTLVFLEADLTADALKHLAAVPTYARFKADLPERMVPRLAGMAITAGLNALESRLRETGLSICPDDGAMRIIEELLSEVEARKNRDEMTNDL